ncbi:MAG: LeuA family protein [Hyphomicrobiales bacterium]
MTEPDASDLIYEWNHGEEPGDHPAGAVEVADETLRDGLQCPSVSDPTIAQKIEMLHLQARLGVHGVDLGLPGAGPRVQASVTALAREMVAAKLPMEPYCAARTHKADIQPIVDIVQKTGLPIHAATFLGSSPIRHYAEGWDLDRLLRTTEEAVTFAVDQGLEVMFVTEDTTRANPEMLRQIYATAIRCGARRICLADTVGYATPQGLGRLVRFVRSVIADTGETIPIDFHGHRDRGLCLANALAAYAAGVDRAHGTILGIGERVGNTPLDLLLINLKLLGWLDADLTALPDYCALVSKACGVPIPPNYPAFGRDAFRTATGVHAAAVIKAKKKGDSDLADRVYSSIPAGMLGLTQVIEVGPMSGESNVVYWLEQHGYAPARALVEHLFRLAKSRDRVFETGELEAAIEAFKKEGSAAAKP